MIKTWDTKTIKQQLAQCSRAMKWEDGFTAWSFKEELYDVYFYLEELLENTAKFGRTEETYLKDKAHQKLLKVLSDTEV